MTYIVFPYGQIYKLRLLQQTDDVYDDIIDFGLTYVINHTDGALTTWHY